MTTDGTFLGQEPFVVPSVPESMSLRAAQSDPAAASERALEVPSLAEIYRANIDFVWRSARRMRVPESSLDDVVQDVFVVVHRRLSDYDPGAPLRGWLYGVLKRVVADHKRRARRKDSPLSGSELDEDGEERFTSSAPSPTSLVERSEAVTLLDRLLAQLSAEKAEVLVLAHLEQLTVPEIAEGTGENLNTVYSRLRTARRELDELVRRHAEGRAT